MNSLPSMFDRYARDFFSPFMEGSGGEFIPRVDVKETDKGFLVTAELPGLTENDISITLDSNNLILSGEKKEENETEDKGYHRSEISYGSFYRSIPLRADVDDNNVEAEYDKGVLKVKLLKKNDGHKRAHKIAINRKH